MRQCSSPRILSDVYVCVYVYGNPLQYSCLENPMDRGAW